VANAKSTAYIKETTENNAVSAVMELTTKFSDVASASDPAGCLINKFIALKLNYRSETQILQERQ
jgi:hypothetical protein